MSPVHHAKSRWESHGPVRCESARRTHPSFTSPVRVDRPLYVGTTFAGVMLYSRSWGTMRLGKTANDLARLGVEALVVALPHCAISELDLSRCCVGDDGAHVLSMALPPCTSITSLVLEGVWSVSQLVSFHHLGTRAHRFLLLTDNKLGAQAASHLASALPSCPHIKLVNLQCKCPPGVTWSTLLCFASLCHPHGLVLP